jgi:glycosyltransferase involved in cell wall biosynthesis
MKILLSVAHRGIYTGGPHQLFSLANGLVAKGHEVVAAFKGDSETKPDYSLDKLTKLGIRVERFRFAKVRPWVVWSELLRFRKFLKEERFDVVHCFKGTDFDFVVMGGVGIPIPVLVITRGNGMPLDFFNSIKYRMKKVKIIMTVSETVRQTVIETGHVNPQKVVVVYGGVDIERFKPGISGDEVRKSLGIPADVPVVGIIGTIAFKPDSAKGGYLFAHSARKVLDIEPETRFVLVGGIDEKAFRPLGEELGLIDRFIFTGFRTDIPALLAAMDLTVCSSIRGEGLMGTVRESLAMQVPVVTTDVGGNKELVREGETGYVVPINDPQAMAERIVNLIRNPEKRREMGLAGRKIVEELTDNRKRVEKIISIYQTCLENAGKRKKN